MTDPKRLLSGEGTPFEQSLLGAVTHEAPPAALRLRMEQALGISQVAAPVVQANAAGALVGKLSAGALALAGIVAGGLWLAGSRAPNVDAPTAPAVVDTVAGQQPEPQAAEEATPVSDQPTADGSDAIDEHLDKGAQDDVASSEARVKPPARAVAEQARASAKPVSGASSLREEITLLDRARQAVKAGKRKRALALLADYDRRFPAGNLGQEASVLRVEALEQEGQLSRASAEAQEFLEQHPESPYAERVERSSWTTD